MDKRKIEERFFKGLMLVSTFIVLGSLLAVLAIILFNGASALTLSMLTQTPKGGYYLGKEGGILNAIVGSMYLAGGATAAAFAIGLPTALYLREYSSKSSFASFIRQSLDVLWGVPSITLGSFIFAVMIFTGMTACLLAGIAALTLLELPIITRAMDEVIRMVPAKSKEASYALGAMKLETLLNVTIRQALPGIIAAILLAFGRAVGDAASVLFTAGYTDSIPSSMFDPVASLPLAVFFMLGTPFPEVQKRAYAASAVLLIFVLSLSVGSRLLTKRFTKYVIR